MSYVHFGANLFPGEALGCGPGCLCRPCRSAAARSGQLLAQGTENLGNLGWDTQFLPLSTREGHEILTRRALENGRIEFRVGSQPRERRLSAREQQEIVRGNAYTDTKYLERARRVVLVSPGGSLIPIVQHAVATFSDEEQRHHALRGGFQLPQGQALTDIVNDLQRQHREILAESNPINQLRKIGQALHLIQDSYCPAHIDRETAEGHPARWCIKYIRHFYHNDTQQQEHRLPDDRDQVNRHQVHASQAVLASRSYLQLVFKAIYGRTTRDPVAITESATELGRFIAGHFRRCNGRAS